MSYKIIVYSFEKKVNSTKRVTPQDALTNTEMDCVINWNGCGIINPHIRINYGLAKAPVNYNYAYIPVFKRYYFCRDWNMIDGLWECALQEDFLATWRDDILSYRAYVLRSASKFNSHISDGYCTATSEIVVQSNEIPAPYNAAGGGELPAGYEGMYVLGIIGQNDTVGGAAGSVSYYAFTSTQMQLLCNKLLSGIEYMQIDWDAAKMFMTEDILKTLYNPIQYIASAMWFVDFPSDKLGDAVSELNIGYWGVTGILCNKIKVSEMVDTNVRQIPVPKHPQSGTLGDWCNLSPYSSYQVHVPPYGLIDFPADELIGVDNISVQYVIDYMTGNGRIMIASTNRFVQIVNFQFGVEVQISQLTQNALDALLSGISYMAKDSAREMSILGAITSFDLSGVVNTAYGRIEGMSAMIGDVSHSMSPTIQSAGSNGARAWYYTGEIFVRLSGKFQLLTDMGNEVHGRPLCKMETLGNLQGFCLCSKASLSFEGNAAEQEIVNAYLNRGFYID